MTITSGFGEQKTPIDSSSNLNIRGLPKITSGQRESTTKNIQIFQNHLPIKNDSVTNLTPGRLTPFVRNPLTLRELLDSGMLNELELKASLKNAPLKGEALSFFEGVLKPNAILKFANSTTVESKIDESFTPANLPLEKFVELFREIKRNPQSFTLEAGGKIYGHEKTVKNVEMEKYATENNLTIVALTDEEIEGITQTFEKIFLPILDNAVIKYNESQKNTDDNESEIDLELQSNQSSRKTTPKEHSKDEKDKENLAHLHTGTTNPRIKIEKEKKEKAAKNIKEYRYKKHTEYISYLINKKELLDSEEKYLINRDMSGRSLRRKIE